MYHFRLNVNVFIAFPIDTDKKDIVNSVVVVGHVVVVVVVVFPSDTLT